MNMAENNEELLREGECIVSYCVEPAVRGKFCASHGCGHGWDSQELCTCYKSGLRAENARLQERVNNQEPWLVALGGMLVQYRIARFPDDVLAWRTERDGYKAEVEGMQAEGCAAVGLVENIFNGLTTRGKPVDPTLAKMADAAAKLLTEATPCEHKALAERCKEALKAHGYHAPGFCWTHKYELPDGTRCDHCEPAIEALEEKP